MRFVLTTGAEPVASWTKINIFLKLAHWVLGSQLCKSDQSGFLCHIWEMLTAMLEGCSRRSVGTIMWPPGWLVLWIIPVHVDRWRSSSDWQQWPERFLSITNKSSCCYVSDLWGRECDYCGLKSLDVRGDLPLDIVLLLSFILAKKLWSPSLSVAKGCSEITRLLKTPQPYCSAS